MTKHDQLPLIGLGTVFALLILACQPAPVPHETPQRYTVSVPSQVRAQDLHRPESKHVTSTINALAARPLIKGIVARYSAWHDQLSLNIGNVTRLRVGPQQMPWLHTFVQRAATALEVEPPVTYIVRDARRDISLVGANTPMLLLNAEAVSLLDRKELIFLIGHALGHLKCDHLLAQHIIASVVAALEEGPFLLKTIPLLPFFEWIRQAEMSADRAGLLLVQDADIAATALLSLLRAVPAEAEQIDVESFLTQKAEAEANRVLFQTIPLLVAEAKLSVPFLATRVQALRTYANSPDYARLLRSKKRITVEFDLR